MNEKQFNAVWWTGFILSIGAMLLLLALGVVGLCWMVKHL